ncbi:MAG: arginine--tRNA ligase [Oscillospiraceae bacterium]|jgi:arginyl-tRNA synthetase|nr:arginine--tRNA ligase [Oscillospiraceae bacterium]
MSKVFLKVKDLLREKIKNALNTVNKNDLFIPEFSIEIPSNRTHGDLSTNAALVCAKVFAKPPADLCNIIAENIDLNGTYLNSCHVAMPGFINFRLGVDFFGEVVREIIKEDKNYGKSDFGKGKKVMVEFVSANPTGPMHLGNARGGSLGDCLSSILSAVGYDVYKEFYVNDAGNQIEKFARSLEARYLQFFLGENIVPFPEDGYHGDDVVKLVKNFIDIFADKYVDCEPEFRKKALVNFALPKNIKKMKEDLKKYRIEYDNWFYESELHSSGEIEETIKELKSKGCTYEKDGTLWIKASDINCEKDKVLVRQNGVPTYFVADIAYHRNKFLKRGFDICVDIWGADHHGHVDRMKGSMDALGIDSSRLKIIVVQVVRLVKDGEIIKMSKRTGKSIGLVDLLEEVEVNRARFLFNILGANSQMDFDLDLATQQSSTNPVYYVQYAHARICSILRKSSLQLDVSKALNDMNLDNLTANAEKELVFCLSCYSQEITDASKNFDPASVTKYVLKIAALFHKFYTSCRIENEDLSLTKSRTCLCLATKIVMKNILDMFKIDAPESM